MHQTNNISSIQLFSEFFHENQEKFLSFAYSYIRDRQEAEDILMESMITLWENRDKWEEFQSARSAADYHQKQSAQLSGTSAGASSGRRRDK